MGKRGPTATSRISSSQPSNYSRWGNAGQPQPALRQRPPASIIADGETRANRNALRLLSEMSGIIADGETRANRNTMSRFSALAVIIADGETRANRNILCLVWASPTIIADGETRANRNGKIKRAIAEAL